MDGNPDDGGFIFVPALTPEQLAELKAAFERCSTRGAGFMTLPDGITYRFTGDSYPEIADQPHIIGGDS